MGFNSESRAHHVYWPDKVKVNVECNVRFKHKHMVTLGSSGTMDPPPVTPTSPTPNTIRSDTGPEPTDPLEGLEGPEPIPLEGHGARAKWPSTYACHILTGKGSASRDANDQSLPCRIPGTSIAKATWDDTHAPLHAMAANIPAGTKPRKKAKAWGSLDWLHWQDVIAKEVSELT